MNRARDYALGWRLVPHRVASDLDFGLKATRREVDIHTPVHILSIEITLHW